MAAKKRKGAKRESRPKSHGLWIAPDLERTIKGEGGRRGLSDPPYGYYLQLADLALGQSSSASQSKPAKTAVGLHRSAEFRVAVTARPPKVDLPKTQAPKPPKLAAPKPPKRRPRPKLSVPKPPKRGK